MSSSHFSRRAGRFALALTWIAASLLYWPSSALAQSYTATLQGLIQDASGAVVPGVRVVLVNEATNTKQESTSSERGTYLFLYVPPGQYRLTAEVTGFRTFVRSAIQLQVQQQATVDVVLQPGEISERIVVTGEAPRLNAVDATLGRVVDNKSVLDLPVSVTNLVALTPGAVMMPAYQTLTNFSGNGTRNANSDVLLDGVSVAINDSNGGSTSPRWTPSRDLIQEFKVQTNSFSAEYGSTGGAIINIVLDSGGNTLRGRLYEYLSHYKLNANNFFSNRAGQKLNPSRTNNFGGIIGGPVYIPKVYDGRNRTFFFINEEMTRTSTQATSTQTVPTALERGGDFSQTLDAGGRLIAIFDPFAVNTGTGGSGYSRSPFPGNVIPKSRMDPAAVKIASYYPAPTSEGVRYTHASNFFAQGSSRNNSSVHLIKIDHNFSDMERLSTRFSRVVYNVSDPNFWGNFMSTTGAGGPQTSYTASADYLRVLGPSTTLNIRWGLFRYSEVRDTAGEGHGMTELGIRVPMEAALSPSFSVEGYTGVGNDVAGHLRWGSDIHHFIGNVTKIRGSHTVKAGAEARLARMNMGQPGVNNAIFSFGRRVTMEDPLRANTQQGNGLASMLLGWGSGSFRFDAAPAAANQSYGFYLIDDIRVTSRLTLNLGVRYELDPPYTERYNRLAWFDTQAKSPISVPQYPDLRGGLRYPDANNRSVLDADNNNVAPRIGIAYRVGAKAVVRAGYGIYYGQSLSTPTKFLGPGFTGTVPWISSRDNDLTLETPISNPFPNGIAAPPGSSQGLATYAGGSLGSWNTHIRNWATKPYFQQWSLSTQYQLPFNSVVELTYSGSRGVHMSFGALNELNLLNPIYYQLGDRLSTQVDNPFYGVITNTQQSLSAAKVSLSQTLMPYPQFTSVRGYWGPPIANSIYHSGSVQFTKRFSRGLSFNAHYTRSKLIDDNSYGGNNGWWGGSTGVQSIANLRLERALSVLDYKHRAVIDFTYALPVGRGKAFGGGWARPLDWALGGWQANGVLTFQSGRVLQPGLQSGQLPSATQRPNLIGDPSLSGPVTDRLSLYLDPAAFSRPAPYTLGTAPRTLNGPRAPALRSSNISLFKEFHVSERRYFQLRAEATNFTNTPVFSPPNMTFGASNFGVITNYMVQPRAVQAAIKLYF